MKKLVTCALAALLLSGCTTVTAAMTGQTTQEVIESNQGTTAFSRGFWNVLSVLHAAQSDSTVISTPGHVTTVTTTRSVGGRVTSASVN